MYKFLILKKLLFLFFIFLLQSCRFFDSKVPDEKKMLEQELKAINWKQVDEYPSVEKCYILSDKKQQKQCFFDFMKQTIQQKLDVDAVKLTHPKLDTIEVMVTIFADASLQFKSQFVDDSLLVSNQKIDSILKFKLIDFPKINPALKRGIPVKTQFVLPIVLKY